MLASEEAASVKDSAEEVKEALQEARRAQTAASSAIRQASADIRSTNNLLSSVSTGPNALNRGGGGGVRTWAHRLVCVAFRWSRRRRTRSGS